MMNKPLPSKPPSGREILVGQIDSEATRKAKAQLRPDQSVYFGLGMMGLVGWSVSVPTLIGAAIGLWLDKSHPSSHSWTLALLVAGLTLGCFNAWHWVSKQDQAMHEDPAMQVDQGRDDE